MQPGDAIVITDALQLPAWEIEERFVRASGPGGQHVNKVSTGVQLRWNVPASSLPAPVKARFTKRYGKRLSNTGDLILEVSLHRSQKLNRDAARDRLKTMIADIANPPRKRIATRPTQGSVRRRTKAKKERGLIKSLRGRVDIDD